MKSRTPTERLFFSSLALLASVCWVFAPVAGRANCCCVRAAKLAIPTDTARSCCHQATESCNDFSVDSPATPRDCHCHFETCGTTPRPAVPTDLPTAISFADVGEPFLFPAEHRFSVADRDAPETFLLAQQRCACLCRWLK